MKLAIIGYGKMGKAIEALAIEAGHEISARIDQPNFEPEALKNVEVAIEFTEPNAAFNNISKCFDAHVPVVVGTTGWYQHYDALSKRAKEESQALFTASNFSIGVNILFEMNRRLAKMMNDFPEYEVSMNETHHIHKKDHPSGTAITLAEDLIEALDRKKKYLGLLDEQEGETDPLELKIHCKREKEVAGFHQINYRSPIDKISISHNAFNRRGFAMGALKAAEWLPGKQGVFGMKDLLKFDQ